MRQTDRRLWRALLRGRLIRNAVRRILRGRSVRERECLRDGNVAGSLNSGTGTSFYSPVQNGYNDAAVIFTWDAYGAATGGWWQMSLDRTTIVASVTYHDSELSDGSDTWTISAASCVANAY